MSKLFQPRVVIVGAGFAELSAAKALRRVPVQVTVVDQHDYHTFKPFLYQVAAALLGADVPLAPHGTGCSRPRSPPSATCPTDVLMFAYSGLSIAMGNADPQVKRAARHA